MSGTVWGEVARRDMEMVRWIAVGAANRNFLLLSSATDAAGAVTLRVAWALGFWR